MKKAVVYRIFLVILFGILCSFCIARPERVASLISFVSKLILPILLGLAMAFIINIPMSALEKLFYKIRKKQLTEKGRKILRAVCLYLSFVLVLAIIAFVMFLVIPELANSFGGLFESLSTLPDTLASKRSTFEKISPSATKFIYEYDKEKLISKAVDWAVRGSGTAVGYAFGLIKSVLTFAFYVITAVVITINLLLQKERIGAQVKKLMAAYLPVKAARGILKCLKIFSETFSNFITGQCLEACILGTMFFISMSILGFPYALIISVLIAFTALIPIFGAFIGLAVGAVLIVIENPVQAFWFIVLFLIMQQIEGNVIYPKVVGGSVGLPPMWTMLAVLIGGNMFGLLGMMFFIPLFSVIYSALRTYVRKRVPNEADKKTVSDGENDENKKADSAEVKTI